MDSSLIQGPGVGEAAGQMMAAPMERKAGIGRQILGQVYGHPIRNLLYEYALTPWNVSNFTQGFNYKGLFGYRGFARNTGSVFSAPTVALRRLIGGVGELASFGGGAGQRFFRAFGKGGLEGVANLYKGSHKTASGIFDALSGMIGGTGNTNIGLVGHTLLGRPNAALMKAFSTIGGNTVAPGLAAADATAAMRSISTRYGGEAGFLKAVFTPGRHSRGVARAMIREASAAGGTLATADALSSAKLWSRSLVTTRVLGGIMTAALIYDIGKFAATNTYKIARYGMEKADIMLNSMGRQNWGGNLSQSFLTSGATSERQRALDEISRSSMNARSLVGNEAQLAARTFSGGRVW